MQVDMATYKAEFCRITMPVGYDRARPMLWA